MCIKAIANSSNLSIEMRFGLVPKPGCHKHFRKASMTRIHILPSNEQSFLPFTNRLRFSYYLSVNWLSEAFSNLKRTWRFFESVESETIGLFFVQMPKTIIISRLENDCVQICVLSSFSSSSSSSLSTRQCLTNRKNCFLLFQLWNQKLAEIVTRVSDLATFFSLSTEPKSCLATLFLS